MIKIIGVIQPFDKEQNFFVNKDGNKIAVGEFTIEEIPETMLKWSKEYDTNKICLMGSKQYNKGLKKQILKAEMTKYNTNKLEIEIL